MINNFLKNAMRAENENGCHTLSISITLTTT